MSETRSPRALAWWMRIVGAFYVLLTIRLIPAINGSQLTLVTPGLDARPDSVAFRMLLDWMFLFGLETGVVGATLLVAARRPVQNLVLAYTVLALELIRGAEFDVYYVTRGYVDPAFYLGFSAVHLVITASGTWAVWRARAASAAPAGVSPMGAAPATA
ncbi:MAG: BphX family protein [Chloroflexi bacterium]|nr:BphX family protein [Chloroflexota bacterium]